MTAKDIGFKGVSGEGEMEMCIKEDQEMYRKTQSEDDNFMKILTPFLQDLQSKNSNMALDVMGNARDQLYELYLKCKKHFFHVETLEINSNYSN
jgi:hypothetical protein